MAASTMLRRASRTFLPLAVRAAGAPRAFHGAITPVVNPEMATLVPNLSRASSLRFSSLANPSSDLGLVQVIDSEIECAPKLDNVLHLPDDFPFKIQDLPGESTILMKREYNGETVNVRVDMPTKLEYEDDDVGEDVEEQPDRTMISMVVSISKGSELYMEVGVTAFPDEITIDSLSMKRSNADEDQLFYEGPEFTDLDENLQKAIQKYLEIRGINSKTANLLFDYMTNKDDREYVTWLKNLKQFIMK